MATSEILADTDRDVEQAVLMALRYFSIFRYPLTSDEIQKYASALCSLHSINETLEELVLTNKVFLYLGYYSIREDIRSQVESREIANKLAAIKIKSAIRTGKFIYNFPFVRFVGISGSLSKGVADENSDFDFFVITAKNRLWVCRTILHLFKKLTFITGDQYKYCMNYFVDGSQVNIEERNIFTAVELITLYPVAGEAAFEDLKKANSWVFDFLPNIDFQSFSKDLKEKRPVLKEMLEFALGLLSADRLNSKLMALTDKRWRKKWFKKGYPTVDYDLAFKTTLHVSKNHPANYQKKILKCLADFKES